MPPLWFAVRKPFPARLNVARYPLGHPVPIDSRGKGVVEMKGRKQQSCLGLTEGLPGLCMRVQGWSQGEAAKAFPTLNSIQTGFPGHLLKLPATYPKKDRSEKGKRGILRVGAVSRGLSYSIFKRDLAFKLGLGWQR